MDKVVSKIPAIKWDEAYPLGNGRIGALVFGAAAKESIVFNHEDIYRPDKVEPINFKSAMETARKEILQRNYYKAERILKETYPYKPVSSPYQPLSELQIETSIPGEKTRYSRNLNLKTGECIVKWKADNITYTRKCFVLKNKNQFVMNFSNSGNIKLSSSFSFIPPSYNTEKDAIDTDLTFSVKCDNEVLKYICTYKNSGKKTGCSLKIATDGVIKTKKDINQNDYILVENYSEFSLYVSCYAFEKEFLPEEKPYDEYLVTQKKLFGKLYGKVKWNSGYKTNKCTEELLLESFYEKPNPAFAELMFNFARYLFISSGTDCKKPPNLQGIWNGSYRPVWSSDYHNDENIQMNYWFVPKIGFAHCLNTLLDFYGSFVKDYEKNAQNLYGIDGIFIPPAQTVSGIEASSPYWACFTGAAGWICQHFYEAYEYTGDTKILSEKIVPFLEKTAEFYKNFTITENGKRVFCPSLSPENMPILKNRTNTGVLGDSFENNSSECSKKDSDPSKICKNATMDFAIAKEVLTHLIKAYKILGKDPSEYKKLLSEMPEYQVNSDGAFKEWLAPEFDDNYAHRHLSHLYPLFPGSEITIYNNPEMAEAIKVAAEKRLCVGITSQTGWSLIHLACVFARLKNKEKVTQCLRLLLRSSVGNNLFTYHNDPRNQGNTMVWKNPPFQIDACFGLGNLIAEMYMYSEVGLISIAPCVPDEYKNSEIEGLCAKNGIKTDIKLSNGKVVKLILTSSKKQNIVLYVNNERRNIVLKRGKNIIFQ